MPERKVGRNLAYNSVEILLKITGKFVPMLLTATTMTTATNEAINAYSMAVTARLSVFRASAEHR